MTVKTITRFSALFLLSLFSLCFVSFKTAIAADLTYRVYCEPGEWSGYVDNGQEVGTDGKLDAFEASLSDELKQDGNLEYRSHNENVGWTGWVQGGLGQVSGQAGNGLQAIRIKLTGKLAHLYNVFYRVHIPNVGWTSWAHNGQACGSEGLGQNISIIQVSLLQKGEVPGDITSSAFTQAKWRWPLPTNYTYISSYFGPRNSRHHDGFDIPAPEGTPIYAVKSGIVKIAGPNGELGNCVALELDSGEELYYAHMVRVGTSVGERVEKGQVIGFVGTTGNSLGNHLHFEMYDSGGELVNPYNYFY